MNWEESKALTPLKGDFLRKFFQINDDFFLTAILSWLLSQIRFDSIPDYLLAKVTIKELNHFLVDFADSLAEISFPDSD